ncbi:MAG: hypothetical protein E7240_10370 [Lachnospiraceae bacterium]|nr:hypothetical protein [Lachnospiraceae bacterium]
MNFLSYWMKMGTTPKTSYYKYSDDQLLEFFHSENWSGLTDDSRIELFQEMENRSAAIDGRPPANIVSLNNDTCYGKYTPSNDTIAIDVSDSSSYEALDTFVHENNHARQNYRVFNGPGYDDHTESMIQSEMSMDADGKMYNYAQGDNYDIQCNELDSNNKAAQFMLEQKDRFGDDPAYREYIANRDTHYNTVLNELEADPAARAEFQRDQAYTSFVRGDIDGEQFETIENNLNTPGYEDATVADTYNTAEQIHELNMQYQEEESDEEEEDENEEDAPFLPGVEPEEETVEETTTVTRTEKETVKGIPGEEPVEVESETEEETSAEQHQTTGSGSGGGSENKEENDGMEL